MEFLRTNLFKLGPTGLEPATPWLLQSLGFDPYL